VTRRVREQIQNDEIVIPTESDQALPIVSPIAGDAENARRRLYTA